MRLILFFDGRENPEVEVNIPREETFPRMSHPQRIRDSTARSFSLATYAPGTAFCQQPYVSGVIDINPATEKLGVNIIIQGTISNAEKSVKTVHEEEPLDTEDEKKSKCCLFLSRSMQSN